MFSRFEAAFGREEPSANGSRNRSARRGRSGCGRPALTITACSTARSTSARVIRPSRRCPGSPRGRYRAGSGAFTGARAGVRVEPDLDADLGNRRGRPPVRGPRPPVGAIRARTAPGRARSRYRARSREATGGRCGHLDRTLSVSSSTSGSLSSTGSPTFRSQARTTAWSTCSIGTRTSILTPPQGVTRRRPGSRGDTP